MTKDCLFVSPSSIRVLFSGLVMLKAFPLFVTLSNAIVTTAKASSRHSFVHRGPTVPRVISGFVTTFPDKFAGAQESAPVGTRPEALSQKARCAAFHRCLSSASPRDAARLRGVVRVLREWVLARSAPASPLARACALHLLCRDAGFA